MYRTTIIALLILTIYCQTAMALVGTSREATAESKYIQDRLEQISAAEKKHSQTLEGLAPCLAWVDPDRKPWAALLCVHGLGLHNASWEDLGERISPYGIAVYAIDVRGFGSWMKAQGHEEIDFNACLNDVQKVLKSIRMANPGLPVFIIGESMGGAIALQATALFPDLISGLISAVPAGDRFKQKRTDLDVAMHFLEGGANKEFDIGKEVVDQATDDPGLRKEWEDDPLSRMDLSPKELIQFQRFMNQNHDCAKFITTTPVIVFQGGEDKLVKPEGTIELFDELKTPDKQLEVVSGAEHLIFEEDQFDDHDIDLLVSWLDKHAQKSQAQFAATVTPLNQDTASHAQLAESCLRLNDTEGAKTHWHHIIRHAPGSPECQQANKRLLSLPHTVVAPKIGPATRAVAQKYSAIAPKGKVVKPTVLYFSAGWCEPCEQMTEAMDRARTNFKNSINIVSVDIDDPNNHALIEEYNVSPIPTVLFLDDSGQVASYRIGYNDDETLNAEINKLLPKLNGSP